MLTLQQIVAIISLLVAFNVPQPTIDNVQTIMLATIATSTETMAPQTPQIPQTVPTQTQQTQTTTPQSTPVGQTPLTDTPPAPLHGEIKIATIQRIGTLSGTANLWDNNRVLEVEKTKYSEISNPSWVTFSINGKTIGNPIGTPGNYTLMFDTTQYPNGPNHVTVHVDDEAGFTLTKTYTIKIQNY